MNIVYSDHALKRMRQRGVTDLQVRYILEHPSYVRKSFEGRKESVGVVEHRLIKVVFVEGGKYLKIVTII